ncbi:hypothetical protein DM01DRAFT_1303064 [Hesseltinella vesiculosa]|uniref:NOT2/NOT3/NOT5 C-terminal domain-containing protein n=1 Tax=Hesseltinella vesiculosa TaxID=101127 RepID=A0A1X2GLP1_9FUNG|nr:hypothetical protein DM01DRAFT_1303064 [Hesseltinella vesiculosa]
MDDFPALRSNDSAFLKQQSPADAWGPDLDGPSSNPMSSLNGNSKHFGGKSDSLPASHLPQDSLDSVPFRSQLDQDKSRPDDNSHPVSIDGNAYGLLGLLGVIRMTDPDRSMLALGSDLTTLGLDLNTADSIYSTFISPWSDTQAPQGLHVEPGYYLPSCYRNVQASPSAHQRMRTFSDEILFYVFYCMPKDIAQEAAAQELYARNWRYHKELGLWLTKEIDENGRPVQVFRRTSANGIDRGVFIFFDPTTWQKVKREWTLSWDSIEDRAHSSSIPASSQQPSNNSGNPPTMPGGSLPSRGVMI